MLLLDYKVNQSIENMLEHDLTEAHVNVYNVGAIPGAKKKWQPNHSPSSFKPYDLNFRAPPGEILHSRKW